MQTVQNLILLRIKFDSSSWPPKVRRLNKIQHLDLFLENLEALKEDFRDLDTSRETWEASGISREGIDTNNHVGFFQKRRHAIRNETGSKS